MQKVNKLNEIGKGKWLINCIKINKIIMIKTFGKTNHISVYFGKICMENQGQKRYYFKRRKEPNYKWYAPSYCELLWKYHVNKQQLIHSLKMDITFINWTSS